MTPVSHPPGQRTAYILLLVFICANLLLVVFFPPCDHLSQSKSTLPTFDGFYPLFSIPANSRINESFLTLEILVILINGGVGWLLITHKYTAPLQSRTSRGLLYFLAFNLTATLLFPPFSGSSALSASFMPSFEGFYFVFADNSSRHLVDEILFLEIAMLLANAALIWLIMRESKLQETLPEAPLDKPF
jgi:hypothetical protein